MCTIERYRIEHRIYMNRYDHDKPEVFFIDGRANVEGYIALPDHFIVERIPCGYCLECKLSKAREWAFRCMKEANMYESNIMITLTFNDEHVPKTTYIDKETGEVKEIYTLPDHEEVIGKFMKRLRRYWDYHYDHKKIVDVETGEIMNAGIREYGCGEYGGDSEYLDSHGVKRKATERPHYHILLFNIDVPDMKFDRWAFCEWNPKVKNALYKSKIIEKLWSDSNGDLIGHVDLNEVNFETCRYVAGYVTKKYRGEKADEEYTKKNRKAPYTWQSRRPGIANDFFYVNMENFFEEKPLWAVTKKGLKKVKSRYFDKLMEKEDEERFEEIKARRKEKEEQMWETILSKTDIDKHQYIENQNSKVETKNRLMKIRK